MRKLLTLTLILPIAVSCGDSASERRDTGIPQPPIKNASTPRDVDTNATAHSIDERVPVEFTSVDFGNFSYPISWKNQTVSLKDGHAEFYEHKIFHNSWFDIKGVGYADLDGDGTKEAVVQLVWVACGGSCDGGSWLFYVYKSTAGKVNLLSRIETGSFAYQGCGLKSFVLNRSQLVLETFQVCQFDGVSIKPAKKPKPEPIGKFDADEYTRFTLRFAGRAFKSHNREIFPWPEGDALNYLSIVSVKDE